MDDTRKDYHPDDIPKTTPPGKETDTQPENIPGKERDPSQSDPEVEP